MAAIDRCNAPLVDGFWSHLGRESSERLEHRVLPDGCMDFLFDLTSGGAMLVGPMTTAALVELAPGSQLFGVRFRPGAASGLVDATADELVDRDVDLAAVVTGGASLADEVASASDEPARRAAVLRFLAGRPAADARIDRAVAALWRGATVGAAAEAVGVGERQLERLMARHVGLRPKLLGRIARMEHAVALLARPASQAAIAAAAGYADEAHLVRELRALAGATPGALRRRRDVGFVQGGAADIA